MQQEPEQAPRGWHRVSTQVASWRRRAASFIEARRGSLDVLINNAAAGGHIGEKAVAADLAEAEAALRTTLLGTWGLIQATLPLLRRSPHPRIVNVSSGAGSHGDGVFGLGTSNAMGPSYAVAKAALNALTSALATELAATNVRINAVCPGFIATFPGAEAMGARPVEAGARSVLWAALLDDEGPSGGFFRDGNAVPW